MQQRCTMFARRARSREARTLTQQTFQRRRIAADDGIDAPLEYRNRRSRAAERLEVSDELRPAQKAVGAREDKLRRGERAVGRSARGEFVRRELRQPVGRCLNLL